MTEVRIYSVVSNPFRFGFFTLARTLIRQNPKLSFTFIVLYHDELAPLDSRHRDWLSEHVLHVEFRHVDLAAYDNIFRLRDEHFKTPRRLWAAFLILEAFRDDSESYVLCLDADMVCLAPLDDDVLRERGFAAVEARLDDGTPRGFFNTGVMSIGRDVRGAEAYGKIMTVSDTTNYHPASGKADQALLSLIYSPLNAECLPWRYNITRRHVPTNGVSEFLREKRAVFFHYVGSKPWHVSTEARDLGDQEALELWDQIVEAHLDREELIEYLKMWRDTTREVVRAHLIELQRPQPRLRRLRRFARRMVTHVRERLIPPSATS